MSGGRPTKRTPENRAAILLALIRGCPLNVAASAGGMSYQSLNEWRKSDPAFSEALESAEHQAQDTLIQRIQRASEVGMTVTQKNGSIVEYPGSWQAAAWLLERRWSGSFGRRDKVEMVVDVRAAAEKVAAEDGLNADEVLAEAERIVKAGA